MAAVVLGNKSFRIATAAKSYVASIVRNARPGQILPDADGVLRDTVARHPQSADKIGPGIKRFFVDITPAYKTKCLWVLRIDGTKTDIGLTACFAKTDHRGDVLLAMRNEVVHQIRAARDVVLGAGGMCPITGERVTREDCEVDHAPPATFLVLVESFLSGRNYAFGDIKTEGHGDGATSLRLANRELAYAWIQYHGSASTLRVLTKRGHRLVTAGKTG